MVYGPGAAVFRDLPDLPAELGRLVRQVPAGRVTTYGDLAEALGNRIAATRWVAAWSLAHDHPADCPCHRIVRAGGDLGRYIGPLGEKVRRLAAEGIHPDEGFIDLARHRFADFQADRPLERLRRVQEEVVAHVSLQPPAEMPAQVGGLDVSYPSPTQGVAGYALVEIATRELVWSTTIRRPVRFPYITTYLSFREIPLYLDLLDVVRAAGRLAPVVLVDGTGILHPRHAGITTHLGVAVDLPTVGVTKTMLTGKVSLDGMAPLESRPVLVGDAVRGAALRATTGSRRPIFISPGHRVDLDFSERLVRLVLKGHRLPEPLYWADRLSREARAG